MIQFPESDYKDFISSEVSAEQVARAVDLSDRVRREIETHTGTWGDDSGVVSLTSYFAGNGTTQIKWNWRSVNGITSIEGLGTDGVVNDVISVNDVAIDYNHRTLTRNDGDYFYAPSALGYYPKAGKNYKVVMTLGWANYAALVAAKPSWVDHWIELTALLAEKRLPTFNEGDEILNVEAVYRTLMNKYFLQF